MTTKNLDAALLQFQSAVGNPPKSATNPHFKSKYTPLDKLYDHVKPVLTSFGVLLSQQTSHLETDPPSWFVVTELTHVESGEKRIATTPIMAEGSGPQKFGSAVTYASRYGLMSLLALAGDPDDDGNEAQKRPPKQVAPELDEDVREDMNRLRTRMGKFTGDDKGRAIAAVRAAKMDLRTGAGVSRESLDALKNKIQTIEKEA